MTDEDDCPLCHAMPGEKHSVTDAGAPCPNRRAKKVAPKGGGR